MNLENTIEDLLVLWSILFFILLIWRAILIKKIFEWPWFEMNLPFSDMQFDFMNKLMIETYIVENRQNEMYKREIRTYRTLTIAYWTLWAIIFIATVAGAIYNSIKNSH